MSNKMYDWNKAIEEINLVDYFTHKFPSFYWDGSRKAFVDHPDPAQRSNKFVFFKGKDGKQNYLSRHSGKGGNLIHFIKNEIAGRNSNWSVAVNEELKSFYPLLSEVRQKNSKKNVEIERFFDNKISTEFQLSGELIPIYKSQKDYITGFRGISETTLNSPVFRDVAKTYHPHDKKYYCIGIPLYNVNENIIGVNRVFTYEKSDLFNQKKFLPGSDNRNGFSKSNRLPNTDTFIICEGFWDGMAHYEINKPKNTEYLFSNGELGANKVTEMLKYIDSRGVKNIVLANDNDVRGSYFNLLFLSHIIPNLKLKAADNEVITLSIIEGDKVNFYKVNEMCDHFLNKNNEVVKTIAENKGDKNILEIRDLFIYSRKGNTSEIEISLPNQKEFIEEFNRFIPEMFIQQDIQFSITKSESKDFNDDLKIKKGSPHEIPVSEHQVPENKNDLSH